MFWHRPLSTSFRSLFAIRTKILVRISFRDTLGSRLPVAPAVTISGFDTARTRSGVFQTTFDPPADPNDPSIEYISLDFWDDDEPAGVVWTFPVSKGENLLEALQKYAFNMRHEEDEYSAAFKRFVTKLLIQKELLDHKQRAKQSVDGEHGLEIRHKSSMKPSATSDVRAERAPGKARDKELQLRLRDGESILDVAHTFGKTPKFIMREAKRVLGPDLAYVMRKNKKGIWTDDETQSLIHFRRECMPPIALSKFLRRTKPSVEKKLRELHDVIFESTLVAGPQELPHWLYESLFKSRLINVWNGLIESDMTPTWRKALSEKPCEEWLSRISDGIPESVKKILGGLQPPTYGQLEMLQPVDTTDAGVYARLLNSLHRLHSANERYLYVGSASRAQAGLNIRVSEHTTRRQARLRQFVRTKKLEHPGRFVTLMTMKMNSKENQDVLDTRRTVTLAEAILTVWLGALQGRSGLQDLYQWDIGVRDYTALCSHNPLTMDIVEPRSRGEEKKNEHSCSI